MIKFQHLTKSPRHFQKGSVLVFTLSVLALMFVLTAVALTIVKSEGFLSHRYLAVKQARSVAEGGVDYAIQQLNLGGAYLGSSNQALGEGVFTVIVSGSGNSRVIESTGYIPNAINPVAKRRIVVNAQLNGDNAQFFYGLQVDGGGLVMNNNAGIVGNVYSNGNIVGAPGTYITGDAAVAGGINDTPSQSLETNDSDQFFSTSSANRDLAQSFIASDTGTVTRIGVLLGKVGNPTNAIVVRLLNDANGQPGTASLASGTLTATVGVTPSWINVSFDNAPSVVSGTKYWITLDTGSSSSTDNWDWRKDTTNSIANSASKYTSNWNTGSASWTDTGGNLDYRVWIGGFATKIDSMTIGSNTTGTGRANSFINTKIHGSNCPNQYCVVENPPAVPLPISDGVIQDWKNEAIAGGVQSSYSLSGAGSLGPKEINGDLTVGLGGILNVTGSLYVTGNIDLSNNCTIKLDPSYGTGSGVIVADGTINVSNNCLFQGAGVGSYIILLTTKDAKNAVSMTISNNSAGVVYYAGKSQITFANNSSAREATAWGINLSNNVTITYEIGLSSVYFSGGPGAGWGIQAGSWREIASF